jgi:glycerol-3-phosphate dehydrogenase (NAD(P)+)
MKSSIINVIGAGAWGTALAHAYANEGHDVTLWAREESVIASINDHHMNDDFLPNHPLCPALKVTGDLQSVLKADAILLVTPAQYIRATLRGLKDQLHPDTPLIICAKGIEIETGSLFSQIMFEEIPHIPYAIFTGPTFAAEVAKDHPVAMTLAVSQKEWGTKLQTLLAAKTIRPYLSEDLIGTQIGSAVKNVIAIACGIVNGCGLGESTRAAILTRGLSEMARLAVAMGGKRETLMGMCGVGDMILTCSSMQSRNFSFGAMIGQGKTVQEILDSRNSVTEGVYTAKALQVLARKNAIEMPICQAVYDAVIDQKPIKEIMNDLLGRPLKPETH